MAVMANPSTDETLRGGAPTRESYAGADLHGRDFREADLRGVDFRGANLRGADFTRARTGARTPWQVVLLVVSFAVSLGVGVAAGYAGRVVRRLLQSQDARQQMLAVVVVAVLVLFAADAVWKGLEHALRTVLPITAAFAVIAGVLAVVAGVGTGRGALGGLIFLLIAAAMVALGALSRVVAGTVAMWAFALVAIAGGLIGGYLDGGLAAMVVAVAAMLVGRRALRSKGRYSFVSRFAVQLACAHGTRFDGADLRETVFDGAKLETSDFRGARLDGARFSDAKFRLCRFEGDMPTPPAPAQGERPDAAGSESRA